MLTFVLSSLLTDTGHQTDPSQVFNVIKAPTISLFDDGKLFCKRSQLTTRHHVLQIYIYRPTKY